MSEFPNQISESSPQQLQDRMLGAYLGLAVGDALGATTEFLTPREIQHQYGVHNQIIGGGWLHLQAGQVTDDTEMSLALGDSIILQGEISAIAVAEAFSQWMRNKPVDIGNTVRRGIVHYRTSGEPHVAENEHDAGNGACMRCLPIAIFHYNSPWAVIQKASQIQSHTTHHNPVADAGTETVLKMLIAAFNGRSKSELEQLSLALVSQYPVYRYDKRRVENPSGWIVETLQSVFQAFFNHDTFEEIMIDIVNRGGDSDTTGAIAGMLAGALYSLQSIPSTWLKKLDNTVSIKCQAQTLKLLSLNKKVIP